MSFSLFPKVPQAAHDQQWHTEPLLFLLSCPRHSTCTFGHQKYWLQFRYYNYRTFLGTVVVLHLRWCHPETQTGNSPSMAIPAIRRYLKQYPPHNPASQPVIVPTSITGGWMTCIIIVKAPAQSFTHSPQQQQHKVQRVSRYFHYLMY